MKKITFQLLSVGLAIGVVAGCNSGDNGAGATTTGTTAGSTTKADANKPVEVAFVTNNASDYWTIARAGTDKAQKDFPGVKVDFEIPSDPSSAGQKTIIDNMVAKGVQGIAISPIEAVNQTPMLNDLVKKGVLVITQDSDAPKSDRAFYVGTDNIAAGKMMGDALKKALPNGGKVGVFVGQADVQNAKERFEGLQDSVKGTNIQFLPIIQDDADHGRAKTNVLDTLVKVPDVAGLVGLWSYNGPAIYGALKQAGKIGKVKVVCFDSEPDTVLGIQNGAIAATVVQQPFQFGYDAVKVMAAYLRGDKSAIPGSKMELVPTQVVDKSNIDKFVADQNKLLGKS